jgi:hypothetical protein
MGARNSLRRLLSVAAVGAFAGAVMLGIASPASATTSMTCAFLGAAAPIVPGPQGIIADTIDAGGPVDTDSGVYHFATAAVAGVGGADCVGATNRPGLLQFAANGNLNSDGSYTNIVCGTGSITSSGATASAMSAPGVNITSANYDASFVAGEGPLVIHSATLANGDVTEGAGWISLVPTQPALPGGLPCITGPATVFDVQGFFTVESVP